MICYASRTGTGRNLDALRRHGWGLLVSRAGEWRTEGFARIVGDNGAWADFRAGRKFDEDAYDRFLEWIAEQTGLDWLVLPDIVAGGAQSLKLSLRYLNRCLAVAPLVLIAVQDGITESDIAPLVGPTVGVFLGGSTEWKLQTMRGWGEFCADRGVYYHVARVNSAKRMYQAIWSGAQSIDGSSVTRFACTAPHLSYAARANDFFAPRGAKAARFAEPLPENWRELDSLGSFHEAIRAIGEVARRTGVNPSSGYFAPPRLFDVAGKRASPHSAPPPACPGSLTEPDVGAG